MPKSNQQAFTLVEIMIVIAIIGILSMIAIPAYNDFAVRTKVAEGLSLASGAKTSIMEYYLTQGHWPTNNGQAGLPDPDTIHGKFVKQVNIENNHVVITFGSEAGQDLNNKDLIMSANDNGGAIQWDCKANDIENKYLPPNCRTMKQELFSTTVF